MNDSNLVLLRKYVDDLLAHAEKIIQGVEKPLTVRTLSELVDYFNLMLRNVEASTDYLAILLNMNKYLFDILNTILIHLKTLNDVLKGEIDSRNLSFIFEFEEAKFETMERVVFKLGELVKKVDDAELKNKVFELTNNCLNALCVFTKAGFEKKMVDAEKYLRFVKNTLTGLKRLLE